MSPPVDPEVRRLVLSTLLVGFSGTTAGDGLRRRVAEGLGGVCLFARNCDSTDQVAALVSSLRAERPDLLVAIDEEGGQVTRLEARTGSTLPGAAVLGHLDDTTVTAAAGQETANRLSRLGINVVLAPVADVNVEPRNPVIGVRSFGDDPQRVARHVAAFTRGVQSAGVAACAKHFPGHGDTTVDSHLDLPVVRHDRTRLDRIDLPPFRAAIDADVAMVMSAHVVVPALDDRAATMSGPVMTGLLRDELGFDGVAATDALEMAAVSRSPGVPEAAAQSMLAGADLICTGLHTRPGVDAFDGLVAAVVDGRLPVVRLEQASQRVSALAGRLSRPTPPSGLVLDAVEVVRRAAVVVDPDGRIPVGPQPVVAEVSHPVLTGTGGAGARLSDALEQWRPGVELVPVHGEPSRAAAAVTAARGRPLVVVARDLAPVAATRSCVNLLLGRRPDAVVVLTGQLADADCLPAGTAYVCVHGPGAVHVDVAAGLLAGCSQPSGCSP